MKRESIYVESLIKADMDKLWMYTQLPEYHEKWDLRFSEIHYLPKKHDEDPQRFLYKTKIGFGASIAGEGESIKELKGKEGERTSSLKFWSDQKLSLISVGRGYWQYKPTSQGILFKTKYDYQTRFGIGGGFFDYFVFRPLMGWATAWSFDCLRLWLERGLPPLSSIRLTLVHWLIRLIVAFVWLYQGLIPKILYPEFGELQLLQQAGLGGSYELRTLYALGLVEIAFGLLLLFWSKRWMYVVQIGALVLLTIVSGVANVEVWFAPFNPLTLNLLLLGFSVMYICIDPVVPKASNCKRKEKN
ncbi:DoxX-like family protein [Bacillus horti]|nr:DoxX-like family protein [Bacillus horti]